ncbi:MAG: hypothetical protein U0270_14685 [Labilithrix sp.]
MSEYRDALASAKERVARLEALAKEQGFPHRSHRTRNAVIALVVIALATTQTFCSVRKMRERDAPLEAIPITKRAEAPPIRPLPPRDLEWFEAMDSYNPVRGPQEVWAGGKHLLVGMLWKRGERTNGLHVGAFDFETLKSEWVAGPFESEWSSEDQERFHLLVDGSSIVLADAAGLLRVLSTDGDLVGKRDMPRGTIGLCRTVHAPIRLAVGSGAHDEASTASALFPWELDRIKPYYFDPALLQLTAAPNTPPMAGTWCATDDYCDVARRNGCRDSDAKYHYDGHHVRIETTATETKLTGGHDTDSHTWTHAIPTSDGRPGLSAISERYFFHGYIDRGRQAIIALDLVDGHAHFMANVDQPSGARLRLLRRMAPDRVFALYDDEMLVFRASGERLGRLVVKP